MDPLLPSLPDGKSLLTTRVITQQQLVDSWAIWLQQQQTTGQLAELTVTNYQSKIRYWIEFIDLRAHVEMPSPATVQDYVAYLLSSDHSPATVNAYLNAVKALYRWCESSNLYPSIARSIQAIKEHRDGPLPALTHEQIASLLQEIPEDSLMHLRNKSMIALMYTTAFRCVSMVRSDIDDLDLNQHSIKHQPKGHLTKDARAVFPSSVSDLLRRYLDARREKIGIPLSEPQPLFIAIDRRCVGDRITAKSIREIVLKYMELCGFAKRRNGKLVNPGVFSAHSIRRSASVTTADRSGMEVAQGLLGHASIETTRKAYVRIVLDRQLRDNAEHLNPL